MPGGSMKKQKKQLPTGSSDARAIRLAGLHFFRRHAVWLFPGVALWHAMVTYGLSRYVGIASLWAAALGVPAGLALRFFVKRTPTLIALSIATVAVLTYVIGIVSPISLLYATHKQHLVAYVAPIAVVLLAGCFVLQVMVSFRVERSNPIPNPPLDPLVEPVRAGDSRYFLVWGGLLGLGLLLAAVFHGEPGYLTFLTLCLMPLLGLFMTGLVARNVTMYFALRRFERLRGEPHWLPGPPIRKAR
jgi:hypothetical protein